MITAVGIGIVIQRCRFCFVRSFRDPFMTGEAVATRAVALSVILSVFGFFAIKWFRGRLADDLHLPSLGSAAWWAE